MYFRFYWKNAIFFLILMSRVFSSGGDGIWGSSSRALSSYITFSFFKNMFMLKDSIYLI